MITLIACFSASILLLASLILTWLLTTERDINRDLLQKVEFMKKSQEATARDLLKEVILRREQERLLKASDLDRSILTAQVNELKSRELVQVSNRSIKVTIVGSVNPVNKFPVGCFRI